MRLTLCTVALILSLLPATAQFAVGGDPRVNPDDFVVTRFAGDLNYPVGMVELDDGSLLVAVSRGDEYFNSPASQILRLVDVDDDGVADQRQILVDRLTVGKASSLRRAGDLLFLTGQGTPIAILRLGPAPDYAITEVGRLFIGYSGKWLHRQSALLARRAPGTADLYELYFPLGSKVNFARTADTLSLSSDFGIQGRLAGDAIHRVRFRDDGATLSGIDVVQIATGLRSASGLAFQPQTGDLYFEDNGIDGLVESIEPLSADEINLIPAGQIGGPVEDFGFPDNYIEYRTGAFIGGLGIAPRIAFTPIPEPADGAESEGPNEIAFAPPGFPEGLNDGLFVGFHGQFSKGGLANEENPLVYVDLTTGEYFHFVSNQEPAVGHLDGLLATGDRLYVADISSQGGFTAAAANSGAIYQIRYVGASATAVLETEDEGLPAAFDLAPAFPNPFNPTTTVRFTIPATAGGLTTTLTVYGLGGQRVRTLLARPLPAGTYRATWDGTDDDGRVVASGPYFLRLRAGDRLARSRAVVLLK